LVTHSGLKHIAFQKTRRLAIICDEAQKFKNPESALAKCMFQIAPGFHRRLVMTGTPVANRPYDIWSLIFFLDQGKALGTNFELFRSQHDLTARAHESSAKLAQFATMLEGIFEKVRPFSVRTTKRDANLSLPTKEILIIKTEFESAQRDLYSRYRDELRAEIVQDGKVRLDQADDILKRLLRLVQVASNPFTIDESYTGIPGKVPELERVLSEELAPSEKAIVWTSFTDNADWLRHRLKAYGPVVVHGKMNIDRRNFNLDRFKHDAECRVLVATPGAAKEGLTLTVANFAIFFDRSFSLDDYLQAQDRIHRISQLMGFQSVGEWKSHAIQAFRTIVNRVLRDSLKTNSPIPPWAPQRSKNRGTSSRILRQRVQQYGQGAVSRIWSSDFKEAGLIKAQAGIMH
jgi:SNF2 family DNA or RNA helicase